MKIIDKDYLKDSLLDDIKIYSKIVFYWGLFFFSIWLADEMQAVEFWMFCFWSAIMFFFGTVYGKENHENN